MHFEKGGQGPDEDDLHFDMAGPTTNAWNGAVFAILFDLFEEQRQTGPVQLRLPPRPKGYVTKMLVDRFRRCRSYWKAARPKLSEAGGMETPDELKTRLTSQTEATLKKARHNTRRRSVSLLLVKDLPN
jgi:hypothetical protein